VDYKEISYTQTVDAEYASCERSVDDFLPRDAMRKRDSRRPCLCDTLVCCIKIDKDIKLLSCPGIPVITVSRVHPVLPNSKGNLSQRGI